VADTARRVGGGRDGALYVSLALALTVLTGIICAAGFCRLGFADFLGRPVLVGVMNGIAITIVLGQAPVLLAFQR
jgi:MFS superfamily sulfate permease-like transporter